MIHGYRVGVLAIIITAVLWGTTGTAATFAPEAGPLAIGAAALGLGGLAQAVIAVPALRAARTGLRAHARLVAVGAGAVGVYPLAFYSSMHLAGVAIGSVVSLASAPLASGLLQHFVQRRPLGRPWALAAALGIAGSTVLCLAAASAPVASGRTAPAVVAGVLLGLVAGSTYATYSWAVGQLIGAGVSRAAAMGAVFGAGGALLVPVLLLTGAPLLANGQATLVAGYMAVVPMFAGYLLFGFGLARVPAATATTITLAEPAVATVLAVLVVGERLPWLGWAGMVLVAAALVLLAVHRPRRSPRGQPALQDAGQA
ncbi:DMT family transporter [Ruania albidiflava]|uniref:DMT family transporter n=1 Tax=Ruania albidiflava TaxID=366586 RepID=UPI0003B3EA3D|nr:DMT family transporter [Ruania albidiflava]